MRNRMRPSKVVLTFGPGSIVDLPGRESVLVMGADFWHSHRKVLEPRLANKLHVNHFGSPRESRNVEGGFPLGIPVRDFPLTRVCPSCNRLLHVTELKWPMECPKCPKDEDGHGPTTLPPRLIAGCARGHLEDFPWRWWLRGCKCGRGQSTLRLKGEGADTALSDMTIECDRCGAKRDFMGALTRGGLTCRGFRPWLGDKEDCEEKLKGLMRGASNVFFPRIESSLSIPPFSEYVHVILKDHLETARDNWLEGSIDDYITYTVGLRRTMEREGLTHQQVRKAFDQAYGQTSERGIKEEEWERLTNNVGFHPLNDFQTEPLNLNGSDLERWFTSIRRVTKLREVVAIRGLTRVEPFDGNEDRVQPIRIEDPSAWATVLEMNSNLKPRMEEGIPRDWLPGVEMFGEGIFFEFDQEAVDEWEDRESVTARSEPVLNRVGTPPPREGVDTHIPRTLLLHTFAHQMIRQISFACGYSSASLRERLYSGEEGGTAMLGVLIYTASSDSEGTLGGLVAQAKDPRTLSQHVRSMLESVRTCSQDPLCGAHNPRHTGNPWGASCHSCSQLPETSCEGLQNKILDRYALVSIEGTRGYFDVD